MTKGNQLDRDRQILAFIREFQEPHDWHALANIARWRGHLWTRRTRAATVVLTLTHVWGRREYLDAPDTPHRGMSRRDCALMIRHQMISCPAV